MSYKLLVIDDDEYTREIYQEVFKNEGYEVDTAIDGEMGFMKIVNGQYDMILLDIMLPKLDGIGLLKRISTTHPRPQYKKLILLTNLTHDPIIREGLALGATGYLIKADHTPDTLLTRIKTLLES